MSKELEKLYNKMDEQTRNNVKKIEQDLIKEYAEVRLREKRKVFPKTWKEDYLKHYNVTHIQNPNDLPYGDNVIYCTSCTGTKSGLSRGTAKQMYAGKLNQKFYNYMEQNNIRYGTISGHLGLVLQDEEFDAYDLHTTDMIFEEILIDYGKKIAKQCEQNGIDTIVFCYSSPLMSEPFIKRLYYASQYTNLKLLYVTKLSIVGNK